MDVIVSAPVFPSEEREKVVQAVVNIFPLASFSGSDGDVRGTADMERFGKLIRKQKILDSARSVMLKGRRGASTTFRLNKQAAFAGRISFADENTTLGTITVILSDDDIDATIDSIAPVTVDGEEVRI